MEIKFSSEAEESLKKIKQKDNKLFSRINKQLILFAQNPTHPSLRTHKLTGNLKNMWSISISMSVRMVYIKTGKNSIVFVKIGTHEETYR